MHFNEEQFPFCFLFVLLKGQRFLMLRGYSATSWLLFFVFFASPVGGSGGGVGGRNGVESWRSAGGDAVRGLAGGTGGSLLDPATGSATVRK